MAEGKSKENILRKSSSGTRKMAEAKSEEKCTYKPTRAFDGSFLYRSLRVNEDWSEGLAPKDPTAKYPPSKQVEGQKDTQYISTTASLKAAIEWADLSVTKKKIDAKSIRIVKIDVKEMKKNDKQIINLTDPMVLDLVFPNKNNPRRKFATYYEEVLIEGYIKSDCLSIEYTSENDIVGQITKSISKVKISKK